MIRSMTAFADGEIEADNLIILCELRSVNHRYSDVSVKLPERLRFAEIDVRRLIAEKLKRGKIECALNYKKQLSAQSFAVNTEMVEKLLAATAEIEPACPILSLSRRWMFWRFQACSRKPKPTRMHCAKKLLAIAGNTAGKNAGNPRPEKAQQLATLADRTLSKNQANWLRPLISACRKYSKIYATN